MVGAEHQCEVVSSGTRVAGCEAGHRMHVIFVWHASAIDLNGCDKTLGRCQRWESR